MNTYIALLRGINVSGHKKVPMVELREILSKTGFNNIKTYIQSGNVIFGSSEGKIQKLKKDMYDSIKKHFGFEVGILIKAPKDIRQILDYCPFSGDKKANSYFTLLYSEPKADLVNALNAINYPNEEFVVSNSCVYFFSSKGYGNAKCNNNFFERKLKVSATTRNYKTMLKLLSLCEN